MNKSGHGGRRKGAGQKPGGAIVKAAAIELAEVVRDYEDRLEELIARKGNLSTDEKKDAYVGLTLRGYGNDSACDLLGVHEQLGWYYRRQSWFKDKIKEGLQALSNESFAIFGPMLPQAMKVYEKHLGENNLKAAQDVADRLLGKPIAHEVREAHPSIHLHFHKHSERDVREAIEGEVREVEA